MARPLILSLVIAVVVPAILVAIATIRRKSNNPEKSWKLCLLNVVLFPMKALGLGPFKAGKLTLEKAMKYAMKKTKLTEFGETRFVNNYALVTNSKTCQSLQLTPIGYFSYRIELNMTMCRRLMHIDYVKRFPQVLNTAIREPLFVLGMPRTGTTFLHRLLSLDPAVRSPLTWELLAPIPRVDATVSQEVMNQDLLKRKKHIKKMLETRQSLGDRALQHIHEIAYDLPEECLLALTDEIPLLISLLYPLFVHADEYFNGISFEDMVKAYEQYKETLQILAYSNGDRDQNTKRWVLKCPAHVFHTKEIVKAFPGAKIVWTHRHPISAIPSMCSLLKSIHQVYYEPDCRDDNLIGQSVKRCFEQRLAKIGDDVESCGQASVNVVYENLVKDPVGVIKSIYSQYNWEFSAEYEKILNEHLEDDRKKREEIKKKKESHKGGKEVLHSYTPEEFGLTPEELSTGKFSDYVKRYNIPMSKN